MLQKKSASTPTAAPSPRGPPLPRAPPTAPQKSRAAAAARRGVKRRREREKKERCTSPRRTQRRDGRACARGEGRPRRERDARANYYHLAGRYRITHCRRERDHAPAAPRGRSCTAIDISVGDPGYRYRWRFWSSPGPCDVTAENVIPVRGRSAAKMQLWSECGADSEIITFIDVIVLLFR